MPVTNAATKMQRARHAAERRRAAERRPKLIVIETEDLIGIGSKQPIPDWMHDLTSDFGPELKYAVRNGMA